MVSAAERLAQQRVGGRTAELTKTLGQRSTRLAEAARRDPGVKREAEERQQRRIVARRLEALELAQTPTEFRIAGKTFSKDNFELRTEAGVQKLVQTGTTTPTIVTLDAEGRVSSIVKQQSFGKDVGGGDTEKQTFTSEQITFTVLPDGTVRRKVQTFAPSGRDQKILPVKTNIFENGEFVGQEVGAARGVEAAERQRESDILQKARREREAPPPPEAVIETAILRPQPGLLAGGITPPTREIQPARFIQSGEEDIRIFQQPTFIAGQPPRPEEETTFIQKTREVIGKPFGIAAGGLEFGREFVLEEEEKIKKEIEDLRNKLKTKELPRKEREKIQRRLLNLGSQAVLLTSSRFLLGAESGVERLIEKRPEALPLLFVGGTVVGAGINVLTGAIPAATPVVSVVGALGLAGFVGGTAIEVTKTETQLEREQLIGRRAIELATLGAGIQKGAGILKTSTVNIDGTKTTFVEIKGGSSGSLEGIGFKTKSGSRAFVLFKGKPGGRIDTGTISGLTTTGRIPSDRVPALAGRQQLITNIQRQFPTQPTFILPPPSIKQTPIKVKPKPTEILKIEPKPTEILKIEPTPPRPRPSSTGLVTIQRPRRRGVEGFVQALRETELTKGQEEQVLAKSIFKELFPQAKKKKIFIFEEPTTGQVVFLEDVAGKPLSQRVQEIQNIVAFAQQQKPITALSTAQQTSLRGLSQRQRLFALQKQKTLSLQRQQQRQALLQKQQQRLSPSLLTGQVSLATTGQVVGSLLGTTQAQGIISLQQPLQEQVSSQQSLLGQTQLQQQRQLQQQLQQQRIALQQEQAIELEGELIPPITFPQLKKTKRRISKTTIKAQVPGFHALVKRKLLKKGIGKGAKRKSVGFQRVNKKALTKKEALGLVMETLDIFANRSGKIKKANKLVRPTRPGLARKSKTLASRFRRAKRDPFTLVERSKFAISSPQEKKAIPFSPSRLKNLRIAQQRKKKKTTTKRKETNFM